MTDALVHDWRNASDVTLKYMDTTVHYQTTTAHYQTTMYISGANHLMTSSKENIFRFTGPLCEKFADQQWIPLTQATGAIAAIWYPSRWVWRRTQYDVTVTVCIIIVMYCCRRPLLKMIHTRVSHWYWNQQYQVLLLSVKWKCEWRMAFFLYVWFPSQRTRNAGFGDSLLLAWTRYWTNHGVAGYLRHNNVQVTSL